MEPECRLLMPLWAAKALQPTAASAGDFVDRGAWGLETLLMLACWKILLPGHFFLVRGNHECTTCTHMYGFRGELLAKFKSNKDFKVPLSSCAPLRLPLSFVACLPRERLCSVPWLVLSFSMPSQAASGQLYILIPEVNCVCRQYMRAAKSSSPLCR